VIAVVDYKAGNLTSVLKALRAAGASELKVTEDPADLQAADKLVLPGVGHFAATQHLRERGLEDAIRERTQAGVPFLGICVGLQWLFAGSTEAPGVPGLGAFEGECTRFDTAGLKCPHVGWNGLSISAPSVLTAGIATGEHVYRDRRARQHHGRAVSSGEVRGSRAAPARELSGDMSYPC
jgi:glutamine amidotransferase